MMNENFNTKCSFVLKLSNQSIIHYTIRQVLFKRNSNVDFNIWMFTDVVIRTTPEGRKKSAILPEVLV